MSLLHMNQKAHFYFIIEIFQNTYVCNMLS